MVRSILLCGIGLCCFVVGTAPGAEPTDGDSLLQRDLKHSHIALMPEWRPDDIGAFRPLRPSVVAWGNDAVHCRDNLQPLEKLARDYRELGIQLQSCNVWMLTATARVLHDEPQYRDAVCVDIAGQRIVPGWLDSNYKGVKPYWGCTNHPLFRRQLAERVRIGIASGANMLHLDDHLGTSAAANHSGGCFCDFCLKGFRAWLQQNLTPSELAAKGIADLKTFDYRATVRDAGFVDRKTYMQGTWRNEVPLREEFLAFQRDAAAQLVRQLGDVARETAGRPVPVGVNSYNLSPTQLATSHQADFFANEVQHYDQEDTIPPMVYLLGTALGKPVFSTGSGHCWIKVQEHGDVTRVRRWIATAHAFGHYSMFAYKKWGFSKATGTKWYITPISTYEPLCRFISENAALFDGYESVAQVGVLYDNAACRNHRWQVRDICRELHYANIPCGLALAGDGYLRHPLTEDALKAFEFVVVPTDASLTGPQAELLKRFQDRGRAISWSGVDDIVKRVDAFVSLTSGDKVWALPRQIPNRPDAPTVVHLLNQDYDPQQDAMRAKSDIEISIRRTLVAGATRATLVAPGKSPQSLTLKTTPDSVTITVPMIDLWAILAIE
jgi:hypothetical protein